MEAFFQCSTILKHEINHFDHLINNKQANQYTLQLGTNSCVVVPAVVDHFVVGS